MWAIRYSIKANTSVFLQFILYVREAFLTGHPWSISGSHCQPTWAGSETPSQWAAPGCPASLPMLAPQSDKHSLPFIFWVPSHLAVTQVPMPFVVQKVGSSSLPLASGSCPPELSVQLLTQPPALMRVHRLFCPRTGNYLFSIYYTPELKPFQCFYSCPSVYTLLLYALHACVQFGISLWLHA